MQRKEQVVLREKAVEVYIIYFGVLLLVSSVGVFCKIMRTVQKKMLSRKILFDA